MSNKVKSQLSPEENNMLKSMFWRSWFLFSSFSMAKMQGYGYTLAMMPVINTFFKDKEEKRKALARNNSFFNCTYETAPFIMGLNAAMEKESSKSHEDDAEAANALKASLMGPLSGIGDSIFWGVIRVIAAGITIPLAMQGNLLAPILFLLIYHIPSILTRYKLLFAGYTAGSNFIANASKSGAMKNITYCATMVGMIMVGAMTASMVTITTPLKIAMGAKQTLVLQTIFDSIMPGLLPLAATLLIFSLVRKKVKVVYLMLGIIIISIVCAAFGIF